MSRSSPRFISFSVSFDLAVALDELADRAGTTRSWLLREAARDLVRATSPAAPRRNKPRFAEFLRSRTEAASADAEKELENAD